MRSEGRRAEHRVRGGAQTFRRGRAIAFYKQLETKRDTLKIQLADSALTPIHTVIAGELKATESIMADYRLVFALDEAIEES